MFTLKKFIKRSTSFDYFVGALRAYALKGDEAAGLAAFVAASDSSEAQQGELVGYLWKLSADMEERDGHQPRRVIAARLDSLRSRIAAGRWGRLDIPSAATLLKELDRAYYDGYGRTDPTIFYQRYPDLRDDPLPSS